MKRVRHLWQRTSRFNTSFWSHENSDVYTGHAGVGILITPSCPITDLVDVTQRHTNSQLSLNRYILLRGHIDDTVIYIHNVYAPVGSGQRPSFFKHLPRIFEDDALHIVMGDFNCVFSGALDQAVISGRSRLQGRSELLDWMHHIGVVDAWRLQNPMSREFTGPDRSSRIDFILLSSRLFHHHLLSIQHDHRHSHGGADHCGIIVTLGARSYRPHTRAPWRCPRWVIELPEAQEYLHSSLLSLVSKLWPSSQDVSYNPGCLVDEHKRKDAIYLRALFTKKKNQRQTLLEEQHFKINRLLHLQNASPTTAHADELTEAKAELEIMLEAQAHNSSRQKFHSDLYDTERCSTFFFRPPQMVHSTQIPVTSSDDLDMMTRRFTTYWSSMYHSPSREFDHERPKWDPTKLASILQYTVARLSAEQQRYLDSPFTAREFFDAFKSMGANKAPGPDGLPLAYYEVDLSLWSRVMEIVYAAQLMRGRMTKFQRRGQIRLLYKSGDRRDPSNYRPITLLNIDAKLGPKILSYRAGHVLPTILHPDQYGFVPGRDIRHAHLRIQALQQLNSAAGTNSGAILLDFAKAFDSVIWDALDLVLTHFGFGITFRQWVRVFFVGTLVSLFFNGAPLPMFELGAGVRQGDPLSPALFVLFIEPLLNYLRVNLTSAGLLCPRSPVCHSVLGFADDCSGLLADLSMSKTFLNLVENFCGATGMTLNTKKTVILPFRPWTLATLPLKEALLTLGVTVLGSEDSTKLLGIRYGPSLRPTERYAHVLAEIQLRCSIWSYRARTLRGKVVILEQIILPVLWYTASVCYLPADTLLAPLRKLVAVFLTTSPGSKTPHQSVLPEKWWHVPRRKGGLGLADLSITVAGLQLHMLCKLIIAIRVNPEHPVSWAEPVLSLFDRVLSPWGAGMDILYAPVTTSPNHAVSHRSTTWEGLGPYWHHILYLWHSKIFPLTANRNDAFELLTMPLLYNTRVRFGQQNQTFATRPTQFTSLLPRVPMNTLQDIIDICGNPPNPISLSRCLRSVGSGRVVSVGFCKSFFAKLEPWLGCLLPLPTGPNPPKDNACALHSWQFEKVELGNITVAQLRGFLANNVAPDLPIDRLGVESQPSDRIWPRDLKMNRHVLPVYADLLFRLQHNALFLGYRFQHIEETTTHCHYGCPTLETAPHLFWYCDFAVRIWEQWLPRFRSLFTHSLEWTHVLYFEGLMPTEAASKQYGYTLFLTLHIIRCIVLRSIWMQRNDIRFNDAQPNFTDIDERTRCLFYLHVDAVRGRLVSRAGRSPVAALIALDDLLTVLRIPSNHQANTQITAASPSSVNHFQVPPGRLGEHLTLLEADQTNRSL